MEQVFLLWDTSHGHGFDLVVILLFVVLSIAMHVINTPRDVGSRCTYSFD